MQAVRQTSKWNAWRMHSHSVWRRAFSFEIVQESYEHNTGDHKLRINWIDDIAKTGEQSMYDFAWLRDNCQCSHCVDPSSGQKLFNREHVIKVFPQKAYRSGDEDSSNSHLVIEWNDGHQTIYNPTWLRNHCMMPQSRKHRLEMQKPRTWKAETLPKLPSVRATDVLGGSGGVLRWLDTLQDDGICLITDSGYSEDTVQKVAEQIAPVRTTTYGSTWRVEAVPGAENIAYTTNSLEMHSDILYYESPPGIQLLHCITQTREGAENKFADAFQIAKDFKERYPDEFEVLREAPITYQKEHHDTFRKYQRPLFDVDMDGELVGVYFSPMFEGPLDLPFTKVRPFYDAYVKWHEMVRDPVYIQEYKLQQGEIITFNNRRILHGRNSFSPQEPRLLIGAYIDTDDFANRLRVLKRDLGENFILKRLGNHSF